MSKGNDKVGEVRALIADITDPESLLAALPERLAAIPKSTFFVLSFDDDKGDWEWKVYGGGISVGSMLFVLEEVKQQIMNIGRRSRR